MAKLTLGKGLAGCLTRFLLVIAAEFLTAVVCMKVFGMGESTTFCAICAVLSIILAFAIYFDNDKVEEKQKKHTPIQEIESKHSTSCPYCLSINTWIDENNMGYCLDCETYWKVED